MRTNETIDISRPRALKDSARRMGSNAGEVEGRETHGLTDARDDALRLELERVRTVNKIVAGVTQSLEKSTSNMQSVHQSVTSASTLLDTWTRILSQTEHNQRLLLHPDWQGASRDVEDAENESIMRQQEQERLVAEEQFRVEVAARNAEEEERKRSAAPSIGGRGFRGARRAAASTLGRGGLARGSGTSSAAQKRTTAASRAGSAIGRGTDSTRGRDRGT